MIAKSMIAGAVLCFAAGVAQAQESQAKSWNLTEQEMTLFQGEVVDILCELSGDCPNNCGDGRRQLGIVRDDGVLVVVAKNGQPNFAGAIVELLPYCGKQVQVDGLMTGFGERAKIFQVQLIREAGDGEWQKANRWSSEWKANNPEQADVKGPWFRKDPRVTSRIEADGYLGLGKEVDEVFIEESK